MTLALVPIAPATPARVGIDEQTHQVREASRVRQQQPLIASLASHVRHRWHEAREARQEVEVRMTDNLRRRRGEYDADKLAAIREQGGSDIFLGITSVKCRAASAWLRETLMGTGVDRPWQIDATPLPDVPATCAAGQICCSRRACRTRSKL